MHQTECIIIDFSNGVKTIIYLLEHISTSKHCITTIPAVSLWVVYLPAAAALGASSKWRQTWQSWCYLKIAIFTKPYLNLLTHIASNISHYSTTKLLACHHSHRIFTHSVMAIIWHVLGAAKLQESSLWQGSNPFFSSIS